MLKRILVVLDGSKTASVAKRYAVELAKETKAQLTGVAIIDTPWISAAQAEPLGGAAFKIHRDKEVIKFTHERILAMIDEFGSLCDKSDVSCQTFELEGFPATEIEKLSQEHDLIVMGKKTDFHFESGGDNDSTVKYLTKDNPRPLVIVGDEPHSTDTVLIAYDGSMQAARALHMFLLLGLGSKKNIHILSIADRKREASEIAKRASSMCEAYGLKCVAQPVTSRRNPADVIREAAKEHNAEMIVMGAYGHHGLREFFLGACTDNLLKRSNFPLFIHH